MSLEPRKRGETSTWSEKFSTYVRDGIAEWAAYRRIAAEQGCDRMTVYRRLNDEAAARHREQKKNTYEGKRARATKRASRARIRSRRRRSEAGESVRAYERSYRRLTRASSQRQMLMDIFEWPSRSGRDYSLAELIEKVQCYIQGPRFSSQTVARALTRYIETASVPPYLCYDAEGRLGLSAERDGTAR